MSSHSSQAPRLHRADKGVTADAPLSSTLNSSRHTDNSPPPLMPLYHFSEEPDIRVFEPRLSRLADGEYVWAIDDWHAPMYYFPRDCPRACFWPGLNTSHEDRERWFGGTGAKMVIAVESAWLDRIRSMQLYRYVLPGDTFELHDAIAGHWVSRQPVTPISIEPVGDLLAALTRADVELRIKAHRPLVARDRLDTGVLWHAPA